MKWAFWRRRRPRVAGPGRTDAGQGGSEDSGVDEAGFRVGQAAQVRVRMRRRLIGAAALLLGTAVVVPMILDPVPRPLPDNIPIDIPSERTAFSPRLSLPAQPAPSSPAVPVPKPADGSGPKAGEPVDEPPTATAPGAPAGAAASAPGAPAGPPAGARSAEAGRWYVQAAALSSESAARQLSGRLSKAGMTPFVERAETNGAVLYRVRLGPYASRDAAVKVRRHLHAMDVVSNVVRVEQAER